MNHNFFSIAPLIFYIASCFALQTSSIFGQDKPLFSTSFEGIASGAFTEGTIDDVEITATGTTGISTKFAHTGKQCLHLLGDAGNSVTLTLPPDAQSLRGVTFRAERWSIKSPFTFNVEVNQNDKWTEIANLDSAVQVGARFLSEIKLVVPDNGPVEAIRFNTTAAAKAGLLIDDLALHSQPPEHPTSLAPAKMPSEKMKLVNSESLFVSGTNNTHTFRIPAICTASNGDLIAACDARRANGADINRQRTIDIAFRRSTDNGKTWTPMEIMDPDSVVGGCSDPSFVVDEMTGDIFCFYNYMVEDLSNMEYRFYVQKSTDNGKTWEAPVDMTEQVAGPELKDAFKFVTSGRGSQTRDGLLVHNFVRVGQGVTVFSSSDHGQTWKALGEVSPGDESKVIELPDGTLMVNSRIGPGKRFVHRSSDGGKTWESEADLGLPDPRCNACIIQYTAKRDGYEKDRLIFCNAASNSGRENLAARISYDNGGTWSDGRVIDSGPSAYSEITILSDGSFGVLYEPGHGEVRFVRFTLDELTGGEDELAQPWKSPIEKR